MIRIKVTVKGEVDMPPFTKFFEYDTNSEKIFFSGLDVIKNRVLQNLRININETLMLYAAIIATGIREGKSVEQIQEIAGSFLSPSKVMIGVPESLRKIIFDAKIDEKPKEIITLNQPIPIIDYVLSSKES